MKTVQIVRERKEFKATDQAWLSLSEELAPIQGSIVVYAGTVTKVPGGQGPCPLKAPDL